MASLALSNTSRQTADMTKVETAVLDRLTATLCYAEERRFSQLPFPCPATGSAQTVASRRLGPQVLFGG